MQKVIYRQNINTEIFKFIWESKPDKIKRSVLMQDYKNGGLRLLNVDYFIEALKAGWVKRIFDETNKGLWKEFYLEKLNIFGVVGSQFHEKNLPMAKWGRSWHPC